MEAEPQLSTQLPAPKRNPTIHDVAAALGMHKSTVSLGLSGKGNVSKKTRARIEQVAKEMGYEPNPLAQRLATNAGNHLVCLCAGSLDVGITTEKILLIQKELTRQGLESPIYTLPTPDGSTSASQAVQMRYLCRQQPRAIVCSTQMFQPTVIPELASYQQNGGIIVAYDVAIPLECDQVVFDREENAYQAARYLIEAGHRELGLAMTSLRQENYENNPLQNARYKGFQRALTEAGLEVRQEWLFDDINYEAGGARIAADFLNLDKRPTGLCIVNDYVALAFMSEIIRAGVKIPDDLSVIGHDNQAVANYCPVPLTSASQPEQEIVRAVVELLTARLSGSQEPPRTVDIRGEIVVRKSVAPPKR